jgi:hypothetical protein
LKAGCRSANRYSRAGGTFLPNCQDNDTVPNVEPAEDLAQQLWAMRELLEQMVYKLEMQGLLLAANRTRWMPYLNAEIETLIEAINAVDKDRSAASAALARVHGLPAGAPLSEILAHVGNPWTPVLTQHRLLLLSLQAEIEDISHANADLARRGVSRSREIIASLGDNSVNVYDPRGNQATLAGAVRIDRRA